MLSGDLEQNVRELKDVCGKDIVVTGSPGAGAHGDRPTTSSFLGRARLRSQSLSFTTS